jgi:methyl-CpG-binding domain protein 4
MQENFRRSKEWILPCSPHGLIQESLWPNEWRCLVVCILLNCTTRKQVEKILPKFFNKWPDAESLSLAKQTDVENVIACLGFGKRRSSRLLDLANTYIKKDWTHVNQLPGIGEYASRMWEIFFQNNLGDCVPNDGALALYWNWRKRRDA